MKKIYVFLLAILISNINIYSREISGKVFGLDESRAKTPLQGAIIKILNSDKGTKTDKTGSFTLDINSKNIIAVIYAGYVSDTIEIQQTQKYIEIEMLPLQTGTVVVNGQQPTLVISKSTLNSQLITTKGLRKAACCNLSESFTTNPSVDVNYSDAVTGAKQIELLGLEGIYTQMMTENVPNIRGLATTFGMNYIPGQWMESIQISKGAASVSSGYESITGQINVEYLKPPKSDPLVINIYTNSLARIEADITSGFELNDKIGTNIMFHTNYYNRQIDDNHDSFLDIPKEQQYIFLNRWVYNYDGIYTTHTIKVLNETRQAGQTDYFPSYDPTKYGFKIKTERYELFGKLGYCSAN